MVNLLEEAQILERIATSAKSSFESCPARDKGMYYSYAFHNYNAAIETYGRVNCAEDAARCRQAVDGLKIPRGE